MGIGQLIGLCAAVGWRRELAKLVGDRWGGVDRLTAKLDIDGPGSAGPMLGQGGGQDQVIQLVGYGIVRANHEAALGVELTDISFAVVFDDAQARHGAAKRGHPVDRLGLKCSGPRSALEVRENRMPE